MLKKELNLCVLTERLMEEVIHYGILEVSTGQYRNVCTSLIRFAETSGVTEFSFELIMNYHNVINFRVKTNSRNFYFNLEIKSSAVFFEIKT